MGAGEEQFARTVSEYVLTSQSPDDVSVLFPSGLCQAGMLPWW